VTGSAYTAPSSTGGAITGTITDQNGMPIQGAQVTAFVNTQVIQLPTGVSALSNSSGNFSIQGLPPGNKYQVEATAPGYNQGYYLQSSSVTVVAGATTGAIDIALSPSTPLTQSLSPHDIPVVFVRGVELMPGSPTYDGGSYWAAAYAFLNGTNNTGAPFSQLWDCNKVPDASVDNLRTQDGNQSIISGTVSLATNARQLIAYISAKCINYYNSKGYYPSQINIVAHSMGGLIVREALSDSSSIVIQDPKSQQSVSIAVKTVIMLATPNAGSEVADTAYSASLTSFVDKYRSPALSELTTHYVRDVFNASSANNWPWDVLLYTYAGTGGLESLEHGVSVLDAELTGLSALTDFDGLGASLFGKETNDGVVTVASVDGNYYTFDLVIPLQTLSFIGSSLEFRDTDPAIGAPPQDHESMLSDQATLRWIASILSGNNFAPTNTPLLLSQQMKSNSSLPSMNSTVTLGSPLLTASELLTSGSPIAALPTQTIDQIGVTVTSGSTVQIPEISDASTTLTFEQVGSVTDMALELIDPSGNTINSTTPQTNGNVQYSTSVSGSTLLTTIQITNPASGTWQAVMDGSSMSEAQATAELTVYGDSNLTLIPQTASLFHQGQDVVVTGVLADFSTTPPAAILSATGTGTVTMPGGTTSTFNLLDDGLHNDGAPNDGTYGNVLQSVNQSGDYSITYRFTGLNSQGQAFQRVSNGAFSVSSGDASLLGDPDYQFIDTNGDGIADFASLNIWMNPAVPGNYVLSGQLVSASGSNTYSTSQQVYSDGSGPILMNLFFDLNQIRSTSGSGYYHVANLKLFEVTNNETAWLDTYEGLSGLQLGPNITSPPQSATSEEGTFATFSVAADAGTGDTYQWQLNGVNIAGATGSSLSLSAVSISQSGTYTVAVSNTTGATITAPVTLTVTPATTFQHWQAARFTTAQLNNAAVSGATAMPAGDGIPNLLKYALNLNPFAGGQTGMPVGGMIRESGSGYMTLSYTEVPARTDITYTVQVSGNLSTWSSGTGYTALVSATNNPDGVTQTVVVQDLVPPAAGVARFMRLMVTSP
jgi:hypothetical protein